MRPPPPHRATTAHLQSVFPFVSGGALAGPSARYAERAPLIGRDVLGGPFRFDPWELYARGVITSPNVVVMGQLGRGKSSFVNALVWRQVAFGRRAWVVDPKGEYGPLAEACGTAPVRLAPGGTVRLNPLAVEPAGQRRDGRAGADLTASLLESSLRRVLSPEERTAVDLAVAAAERRAAGRRSGGGAPTLPDVVDALLRPEPGDLTAAGLPPEALGGAGQTVALELRRLVDGDLGGMFDGPTSPSVRTDPPVVVLDLSAAFASPALPLIMTCAAAWLQGAVSRVGSARRLVVIDEAWAILQDGATARWAQATWKLARSLGVANVLVVHRVSDLAAAGHDGSAEGKLAAGLLADSETRVVFGQPPAEARATGAALGLGRAAVDLIAGLPRGVALWRMGDRSYLVEHVIGDAERDMVDTDAAMHP